MSRVQILRDGDDTPYTKPIKRSLLRDARLSFGARGLFAMLWDFPNDWIFYSSHIVAMSPNGMTQLKGYLKELRNIGAIKILPKQLSSDEATELNKISKKNYRRGQITGKQWILNNPDNWAIESSLSNANIIYQQNSPKDRFSSCRQNQATLEPRIGNPSTKGLQLEGSANVRQLPESSLVANESGGRAKYIFPRQLKPQELEVARSQLECLDNILAQAVLDELAARLDANKITGAPLSYLRSLITRARSGQFTPEAGVRIAAARERVRFEKINKGAEASKPTDPTEIPKRLAALHQALGRKSSKLDQKF